MDGPLAVVRSALSLAGRAVVRVVRSAASGILRFVRWVGHRWRASLQFRVVGSTVLLCLVVMGLLQTFLYQRIADGLVEDRIATAKEEAAAGTRDIQAKLDKTDKLDVESLRQLAYDLIRQQETQRGETTRELILTRSLSTGSAPVDIPTLDTGLSVRILPDDIREALKVDPGHQQIKIVTIPRAADTSSAVLVGSIVSIPEAGAYELYYVYPLDRQENLLGMVRRTFLLGVVIFAALIGLVSHVVTRIVVDPVREGAVVAERLANGRLNERLDIKGEDDLARLGTAFNDMADTLQAQIGRLEDLSAVQQRFVSDVSHELRTPLTTIRMAAEVMYDDRDAFPPISRRSTELLYDEVERFDALLADLLEISRFDAGAANLERENVDVRDVVERVLAGTTELARVKGSSITLLGADEPLRAEMDPRRVERVVRNLVVNALEHGDGGPIRVELGGNDTAIAVAVRDFGIGLRPGESDLVFTRFWRADPARNRTTGGTGLGLAIALEDARLHDGWLQAWGEQGDGSRFRLTLPRVAGRPIGYSPLPLTDPPPTEGNPDPVTAEISTVGEPIVAGGDPTSAPVPGAGVAIVEAATVEPAADEATDLETGAKATPVPTVTAGEQSGSVDVSADVPEEPEDIDELDRVVAPEELAELEGLAELEAHARARMGERP